MSADTREFIRHVLANDNDKAREQLKNIFRKKITDRVKEVTNEK